MDDKELKQERLELLEQLKIAKNKLQVVNNKLKKLKNIKIISRSPSVKRKKNK